MSFRLASSEPLQVGIRRIAIEQIEKGLAELGDVSLEPSEVVHQIRKRCKKLRGLLRMVRPGFPQTYRLENAAIRDVASHLATVRDADVILKTFDQVVGIDAGATCLSQDSIIRKRMTSNCRTNKTAQLNKDRLASVRLDFEAIKDRAGEWSLPNDWECLWRGVKETYRRARKGLHQVRRKPLVKAQHEWRKRVKDHWYHMRLLQGMAPKIIRKRRHRAHLLSEWLGDNHDLAVLKDCLESSSPHRKSDSEIQTILVQIENDQWKLAQKSIRLGRKLFGEKPRKFIKQMKQLWEEW